jgi:hypothetical protein
MGYVAFQWILIKPFLQPFSNSCFSFNTNRLGKTVIAIALIVANPPPLCRRVLPREHLWSLEGIKDVDHAAYTPPPSIGATGRLSNGTLIIVPMTLLRYVMLMQRVRTPFLQYDFWTNIWIFCSQWVTEIERFAPHLSVITLHNADDATMQAVATSDIVLASTFLMQQSKSKKKGRTLLNYLKRIHWHRIIVDEAHYNQQGQTTKQVLASLSATHRVSVTGTPIGAQLSDLYGLLRFLRIAPFDRPAFWKNNIEDPYHERNIESLRVLRSLLSRICIRHSKDQTFANGNSLVALPPRTVETVHLQFGSEAEKAVYEFIDARNRHYMLELKGQSLAAVASKYFELYGMLTSARQACAHTSLVNLEKLDRFTQAKAKTNAEEASASNTRDGILKLALERARNSAKLRMRVVMNTFQQDVEFLECPVCFECVSERDVAVPSCAHPFCSACILSLLDRASTTREATGR